MKKQTRSLKKKGFSIIELIVVIAIMGILAAIAVPKYINYVQDAKVQSDNAAAKTIADALDLYFIENGSAEIDALDLDNSGNVIVGELESYMNRIPTVKSVDKGHFIVEADGDGDIQVYISGEKSDGTLEDKAEWEQKYPEK